MTFLFQRSKAVLMALTLLALSAGLVFGAMPPAAIPGLTNAAEHAGKTVPVAGGQEDLGEDEDTDEDADGDDGSTEGEDTDEDADEDTDEDADEEADEDVEPAEDAGEHCATDPTALTPEGLEAMNHGAVVCWAAHQTEWPEWFANHGAFVRCWAHQGKLDAGSCTEDPAVEDGTDEGTDEGTEVEPTADATKGGHGKGHAKDHGNKGKAKGKHKQGA